jgi:hypothetical protein
VRVFLVGSLNNSLTSKTDRKGQTITYLYDALNSGFGSPMDSTASPEIGPAHVKTYPDTTAVDCFYDLVRKIQQANDPTGASAYCDTILLQYPLDIFLDESERIP